MVDVEEGDAQEEDEDGKKTEALQIKIKGVEGAKQVSMNTSALEVKINATSTLKLLAKNLGTAFYDHVEEVAKVCLEKLIMDPYAHTLRKESAKVMRFLITACKDHPDRMKALFILTYQQLMYELEKRKVKEEFD